jgi:hypothetical protein
MYVSATRKEKIHSKKEEESKPRRRKTKVKGHLQVRFWVSTYLQTHFYYIDSNTLN